MNENQIRAQALRDAADRWQSGVWFDGPNYKDPLQQKISDGNYALQWLRERADKEENNEL